METPAWKKNLERYDWTGFVKTGPELDSFIRDEQSRVEKVVADLGIAG
jgi:tripartite-type tricarboxylate transporter receptor subunit TctC